MAGKPMPMSKGKRGKAAPAASARSFKKQVPGHDPKSGKSNRNFHGGADKRRTGKGHNSLDGMHF